MEERYYSVPKDKYGKDIVSYSELVNKHGVMITDSVIGKNKYQEVPAPNQIYPANQEAKDTGESIEKLLQPIQSIDEATEINQDSDFAGQITTDSSGVPKIQFQIPEKTYENFQNNILTLTDEELYKDMDQPYMITNENGDRVYNPEIYKSEEKITGVGGGKVKKYTFIPYEKELKEASMLLKNLNGIEPTEEETKQFQAKWLEVSQHEIKLRDKIENLSKEDADLYKKQNRKLYNEQKGDEWLDNRKDWLKKYTEFNSKHTEDMEFYSAFMKDYENTKYGHILSKYKTEDNVILKNGKVVAKSDLTRFLNIQKNIVPIYNKLLEDGNNIDERGKIVDKLNREYNLLNNKDKVNAFDEIISQYWGGDIFMKESLDMQKALREEDLEELIQSNKAINAIGQTTDQRNWNAVNDNYLKKHGKDKWAAAFIEATRQYPMGLLHDSARSLGMMVERVKGARDISSDLSKIAVGTAVPAAIGSKVPLIGTGIGAGAGFFSSISGLVDQTASVTEFFQEEINRIAKEEWERENPGVTYEPKDEIDPKHVEILFEDKGAIDRIYNRSARRGVSIYAAEATMIALAPGVGGKFAGRLTRPGITRSITAGTTAAGITTGGEGLGEYMAMLTSGQEIVPTEVLREMFTPSLMAPVTATQSVYKLNNERLSKRVMQDRISTSTNGEFSKMNIDIKNDKQMEDMVNDKKQTIEIDSQIPPRVKNTDDRNKIVDLEKEYNQIQNSKTISAKNRKQEINEEIQKITKSYDYTGPLARQVQSILNFDIVDNLTPEQLEKKFLGTDAGISHGFVHWNRGPDGKGNPVAYINKTIAAKEKAINVGNHETAHVITHNNITSDMVEQWRGLLTEEQNAEIDRRIAAGGYTKEYLQKNPSEFLTQFSDAVFEKAIPLNDSVWTQIGDLIVPILRAFGYSNISFDSAKGVKNFMRDYSKSIEKGELTKDLSEFIKSEVKTDAVTSNDIVQSKSASDNVQRIYNEQGENGIMDILDEYKPMVNNIVNKYQNVPGFDRQILTDEIETGPRGILDLIREYDPARNQSLAAYINSYLRVRSIEAANRMLETDFTVDIEEARGVAVEQQEIKAKPKPKAKRKINPIDLARDEKIKKDFIKDIKEKIPTLDLKNLTLKNLKDLSVENTAKIFNVPVKKIQDPTANLTKKEKENALNFIRTNALDLISILPEGAITEAASEKLLGTSTGVPKSLLTTFYTKQDRITKGAGLSPYTKNKNISKTNFLEAFGVIKGKKSTDFGPRTPQAQRVKAMMSLYGKLATNSILRQELANFPNLQQAITNLKLGTSELQFSNRANKKEKDKGRQYEQEIYDVFGASKQSIIKTENKGPTEKEGAADIVASIAGFPFNVEAKLEIARYSSVTAKIAEDGNIIFAKDYTFNKELENAINKNIKNINKFKTRAEELGQNMSDFSRGVIDKVVWEQLKIEGYLRDARVNIELTSDIISEFYAPINFIKKSPPVYYIQIKGQGLFYMSENPLNLPIPKLESNVMVEVGYNTAGAIYKTSKGKDGKIKTQPTKNRKFGIRIKPFKLINIKEKSNFNIDTKEGIEKLAKTKAVSVLKQQRITALVNEGTIKPLKNNKEINKQAEVLKDYDNALAFSRKVNKPEKGISVFDFDQTLANTKEKVIYTMPDGKQGTLTAKEFAEKAEQLELDGAIFDFKAFEKVKGATKGPFFELAQKIKGKFGNKDIFVLTARPQSSAVAIHGFLKGIGLNIPIENITGLQDGTPQAKANWVVGKVGEGYNNFFFGDDAYKNVNAVQKVLKESDVKYDVQQAKIQFSKNLNTEFNKIIEANTGLSRKAIISDAKAKQRGMSKDSWFTDFFTPHSAEDFRGLLYTLIGKGKVGDKQKALLKKALLDPFARGIRDLNAAKQTLSMDYSGLKKQMPDVVKKLRKPSKIKEYNNAHAIRVYLWTKNNIDIPGLSKKDQTTLVNYVKKDPDMMTFADNLGTLTKLKEGYTTPDKYWTTGNISTDLQDVTNTIKRSDYLSEYLDNSREIFTDKNMNKLELIYGTKYVNALEDMLYRMEYGTNRQKGQSAITNSWQNWVNNSVGAIMFVNMRSAVLQLQSSINFINWHDNNPLAAGKALANQKQYWKDFSFIFNHPTLKQRRAGLDIDVNASEIAARVADSKRPVSAALNWLLQKGFIPTRIADSFAIASGGATFYRNRINTYIKKGMSKKKAEQQAFLDFQEISEATQQSARPDMISEQQAGPLGRLVLAFQVTPMQYVRLMKRAVQDLYNRRTIPGLTQAQSDATYISQIVYYLTIQNLIFNAMQQGLFALAFSDEEEDTEDEMTPAQKKRAVRLLNGMGDSVLRGLGVQGAAVATIKNMIIKFLEQEKRGYRADHAYTMMEGLNISPPIGSKARKVYSATQTYKFNKDAIKEMGFDINNPAYEAVGNLVSGTTNVPLDRAVKIVDNVKGSLDRENAAWQRIALLLGWNRWDLDIPDREVEKVKRDIKKRKAEERKRKKNKK